MDRQPSWPVLGLLSGCGGGGGGLLSGVQASDGGKVLNIYVIWRLSQFFSDFSG